MLKEKIEFPCGFKYETEVKFGFFSFGSASIDIPKECPLHGKNCVKREIKELVERRKR